MSTFQILYWHDIPLQVRSKERVDGKRISKRLSPRFMAAVDKAAMAARHTSADRYRSGFRWGEYQQRQGEPEAVVDAVIAELEASYATIPWRETADRLKRAPGQGNDNGR